MHDKELWQGYSEQGLPTVALTKDQARKGALHGASHVWIWRLGNGGKKEVLLQVRAHNKSTWPGYLDVSAAGHIDRGETPLEAALRETQEEVNIFSDEKDLLLFSVQRVNMIAGETIENEFQWLYSYELKDGQTVSLNDGEVDSVKWASISDLRKIVEGSMDGEKIVPHSDAYFATLFKVLS